jgi:hypothetical protein
MAAEPRPVAESGVKLPSEIASHEMRITQGGKIHAWVEFALKFFEVCESIIIILHNKTCMVTQENEEKALVLHTLPAAVEKAGADAGDSNEPQEAPLQGIDAAGQEKKGFSTSTSTIPRLISVVEIIKREYLVAMGARRSPDLVGLYQYNEMGSLEDQVEHEEGEESAGDRVKMITEALGGTKK